MSTQTAARFRPFGTTIFAEMSRLAREHDAVNLSQGFPDFDGPASIKDAAIEAMRTHHNQYAPLAGEPVLLDAIASAWHQQTGQTIDPGANVTVTVGATEALTAAFLGLVDPGDEVILFEPFYDSYRACAAMAGAVPRFVTMRSTGGDRFTFDPNELADAFSDRTRAILVNTPHNPTGTVLTRAELDLIASLCQRHNTIALTDEVYEHLTFDEAFPHLRLATLPGMWDRTLTISSLGKTHSLTGWKVGWAIGPRELTGALRAAHQFTTFSVATPLQHGAASAIQTCDESVASLRETYRAGRAFLCESLTQLGFGVVEPAGTYFVMADHSGFGFEDDVAFCRHLAAEIGVAAIPPSAFYAHPEEGHRYARFAFCKQRKTLEEAVRRLAALRS